VTPALVVARLTVQEASRRRLLLALVILTLLVVGFSAWGFYKITTVTRSDGSVLPAQQVTLITSQLLIVVTFVLFATVAVTPILSQSITADTFAGLRARSIGPAVTSGRAATLKAAQESITLLRNQNNTLPLSTTYRTVGRCGGRRRINSQLLLRKSRTRASLK